MFWIFCFLFWFLFLFGFYSEVSGSDCRRLIPKVKSASEFILGVDYPWWYNVGQLEVESSCLWRTSLDGWGSIGYAQITPTFWDRVLSKFFPDWKRVGHQDHFLAQAYIVRECIRQAYCRKLWNVYQCYNRSCQKVNLEAMRANCNHEKAYRVCLESPQFVCVWRKQDGSCRQWRNSCDINYSYGLKVYIAGRKYSFGVVERKYLFF